MQEIETKNMILIGQFAKFSCETPPCNYKPIQDGVK